LDVLPGLIDLVKDPAVDQIGLNPAAIHALWTLHGLGVLQGSYPSATSAAVAALRHRSGGVRRNAVAVLPRNAASVQAILASKILDDADAQVRLAALLALAEMPASREAAQAILVMLNRPENYEDRWIPEAATSAAAAHDLPFLQAALGAKALPPSRTLEVVAQVAEHFARGGATTSAASLIPPLADADPKVAEVVLAGLTRGWPISRRPTLSPDTEATMARLLVRLSPGGKGQLLRLAGAWGSQALNKHTEEIARSLLTIVTDEKKPEPDRIAAARQVVGFRPVDSSVVAKLMETISPRTSPELSAGLIDAVGASQAPDAPAAILHGFSGWTPSARSAALRVLLRHADATRALLDALDRGQMPLAELTLDQKQALAAHPARQLAARARRILARGGSLPNPDRQRVLDQLLPLTKRQGDAVLGKEVFKNQCAKCHMHSGEGGRVGPDLSGVAVHTKEHLLTDIIDPSRSVEGNYRVYTVETKNGQVFNGLLASETRTAVELIDAEARQVVLLRENIEQLLASPKSLMPEGFEKQLTRDELVNLLTFLTQRGRFLPLPLAKAATAVSTRGMFYSEESEVERLVFADWSTKTVDGIPFQLVDPQGQRLPNVILLYGPQGKLPPRMPRSVSIPCNAPAKAIHLLSGVSGWGFPLGQQGSVSLIVRLHYADGKTEDHPLRNGVHFADYIRVVNVPGSKLAFRLRGRQLRYLAVNPERPAKIDTIEFVKGPDATAPIVMAVTVEGRE
jgi:putative heme-binding domain-containing protein